jgi:hypothetical protein
MPTSAPWIVTRRLSKVEYVRADDYRRAVEDRDALVAALDDVINHYVLTHTPEAAVIDRALALLDRLGEQ